MQPVRKGLINEDTARRHITVLYPLFFRPIYLGGYDVNFKIYIGVLFVNRVIVVRDDRDDRATAVSHVAPLYLS